MKIPDKIKEIAKSLRNNMTESETILWNTLKQKKIWTIFLRQKPIYVYTESNWFKRFIIPDFYNHEHKLIIEVDWNIHNLKEIYSLDLYKEKLLRNMGYNIIRIKNEDIKNNLTLIIKKLKIQLKSFSLSQREYPTIGGGGIFSK